MIQLIKKIGLIILLIYIFYSVTSISKKNDQFNLVQINNEYGESFFLTDLSINNENLYDSFPYQEYLNKIKYTDTSQFNKHLKELNILTKNQFLSQSILSLCLTNKLEKLNDTKNLDTLYGILLWTDKFYDYSFIEKNNQAFYESIPSYWYNYVANTLSDLSVENEQIQFNFKYQYLVQKCSERGYFSEQKMNIMDKVMMNVIQSRWFYLIHRFWNNTSHLFKMLFLSLFFINIFLITLGIKYIKIRYLKK